VEYLIQFRIDAPVVHYKHPVEFNFDNIKFNLYLYDLNLISAGKKLHVIIDADSREEAYNNAWKRLGDFNNRLMFLVGQAIVIGHLEFIMENQAGREVRNIFFRDIEFPGKQELFVDRIDEHKGFFKAKLEAGDKAAIGYYNEALRSELPQEKFRALYFALEALVGYENTDVTCDGCGEKLICPKCNKTKRYPRVSKKRIDEFLIKENDDDVIIGRKLTGNELVKLRAFLSHAQDKKLPISSSELNENIDSLSFILTRHIENKYNIPSLGRSMIKYGSVASVDYYQYRTTKIQEEFALDIPPLREITNHTQGTRWIME
jgi:hypothetical protein